MYYILGIPVGPQGLYYGGTHRSPSTIYWDTHRSPKYYTMGIHIRSFLITIVWDYLEELKYYILGRYTLV
jgi:hypothetical protein